MSVIGTTLTHSLSITLPSNTQDNIESPKHIDTAQATVKYMQGTLK